MIEPLSVDVWCSKQVKLRTFRTHTEHAQIETDPAISPVFQDFTFNSVLLQCELQFQIKFKSIQIERCGGDVRNRSNSVLSEHTQNTRRSRQIRPCRRFSKISRRCSGEVKSPTFRTHTDSTSLSVPWQFSFNSILILLDFQPIFPALRAILSISKPFNEFVGNFWKFV